MKFPSSLKRHTSKGFGLLEVILVFAIVIGAAAVVFTVFQSAKPSSDAANEVSNATTIATNLSSTFGINHNYSGLGATDDGPAIAGKIIPASMVVDATHARSQWGNLLVIADVDPTTYELFYDAVPADACAKFVSGAAGAFNTVYVSNQPVKINGKPNPDPSINIISVCGQNPTSSVIFMGK